MSHKAGFVTVFALSYLYCYAISVVQSVAQEFITEEEEEEPEVEVTDHDELTHFMHQLEQANS